MSEARRRVIGVWTEWESELNWTTEGITRLAGFLVEGAAQRDDLTFRFVVTPINHRPAHDMLSGLAAREGEHWSVHSLPPSSGGPDQPDCQTSCWAFRQRRHPDTTNSINARRCSDLSHIGILLRRNNSATCRDYLFLPSVFTANQPIGGVALGIRNLGRCDH